MTSLHLLAKAAVEQIMLEARPVVIGNYQTDAEQWPSQGIDADRMVQIIEETFTDAQLAPERG